MNCLIIDDEPLAREILEGYISDTPGLNLVASCKSAIDGLNYISQADLDVIFLDIRMPKMDGLQFLETVKPNIPVILTTAYKEHAIKGFELNVTDYLLKPIMYDRFLKSIKNIEEKKKTMESISSTVENEHDFIFIKSEYKVHRIDLKSIQYLEGLKDYLVFYTKDQKILSLMSFKAVEPFLKSPRFVRIHKSFIVAIGHINSVEKSLVNIAGRQLPIGRTYKNNFLGIIDKYKVE